MHSRSDNSPFAFLSALSGERSIDRKILLQTRPDDLAGFYLRQQRKEDAAARLTPSSADDPFIELPALQALGDRLWQTRTAQATPFTLQHYRSIAAANDVSESGSPAAAVLEHYLGNMLDNLDDNNGLPDPVLHELRLDVLYVLTDKVAHRKALDEAEMFAELKMARSSLPELSAVTRDLLSRAIAPLVARYVVREDPSKSGEKHYELAHDFVVRSVVNAWTALDRRRAQRAALSAEQQKERIAQLNTLLGMQRRWSALMFLLAGATLAAAGLLGLLTHSVENNHRLSDVGELSPGLFFACLSPALALLVVSIALSVRTGFVFFGIALVLGYMAARTVSHWPITTALLSHWCVTLLCLMPMLSFEVLQGFADAKASRSWRELAIVAMDYAPLPAAMVLGFSWSEVLFPKPETAWGTWFVPVVIVILLQMASIAGSHLTIGELWAQFLSKRSASLVLRTKTSIELQNRKWKLARITALLAFASLNWFAWWWYLDFWVLRFTNPLFFSGHVAALLGAGIYLRRRDRRREQEREVSAGVAK